MIIAGQVFLHLNFLSHIWYDSVFRYNQNIHPVQDNIYLEMILRSSLELMGLDT
jgi:hypothetical protein